MAEQPNPFTPEQAAQVDRELLLDKQRDGHFQRQLAQALQLQQRQDALDQYLDRNSSGAPT